MSDERLLRQINARLSLRKPQEESLAILADVLDRIDPDKDTDPVEALAAIQAVYPQVTDFDRDFPSLCFALATGVGKTRLMGAFIAYLTLSRRSRHFFVLAPNTTIYDKLITDFSPTGWKYVFKGIAEFAAIPPVLVTGETWDQGRGLRGAGGDLLGGVAIINIFNVDKINKDADRIKKLHEYIGESYFDYLAGLPDLVLLMDEAHRYRAKAGMRAVAELRPILGLELTATPRSVGARSEEFHNVIYSYGLAEAMEDGFVKEPAVATRANFNPASVSREVLEQIKLEDGIHAHENVKVELDLYARQTGRPLVHPFMLVVAESTEHARTLRQTIEAEDFFKGRYKGRVIEVHSALRGEENDEAMARLLKVETDGNTDVVIHVNKLKEGWDVTNLYTIVPLRASASDILTEQTLGRGLRLPYGERTGVDAVDTLTVIAHDRFDEVIQRAREPGSLVHKAVRIGPDGEIPVGDVQVLAAPSYLESAITGQGYDPAIAGRGFDLADTQAPFDFRSVAEQTAATTTLTVIRQMERELPNLGALTTPHVQQRITDRVAAITRPIQGALEGIASGPDVARIVAAVTERVARQTIEIPEIVVLPTTEVTFRFEDFDLTSLDRLAYQPIANEIMLQELRTERRRSIAIAMADRRQERPEDYLVSRLIDYDAIDYDATADLLYKLTGQVVARLRSYLADEQEIENVLLAHGKQLAEFVFHQMMQHYVETPTRYVGRISRGFQLLQPVSFKIADLNAVRDYRGPVRPLGDTRKHVFGGFRRCVFPCQSFQSDEERRFAVLIDVHETAVIRWVKPGPKQFRIEYRRGESYEPDFVVETEAEKLIVEIKARRDLQHEDVLAKSKAARTWIGYANRHAQSYGGKPWRYVLVPHDMMTESASLAGMAAAFSQPEIVEEELAT
jgi:type III restriction enzyme